MARVKKYGQFCALARALDQIGDRWSLLIVRELLVAPATYSTLLRRLPGLATNLLGDRLRDLQAAGLVGSDRERTDPYELTERGQALRPVVRALIRWGAPLMVTGPGEDAVQDHWAALALEAVLTSDRVTGAPTRLRMTCGATQVDVVLGPHGRRVEQAPPGASADVELTGSLPELLVAAQSGAVPAGLVARGRLGAAHAVLRPE
jgi:DNA-binding HxlR family transcriptional regulator